MIIMYLLFSVLPASEPAVIARSMEMKGYIFSSLGIASVHLRKTIQRQTQRGAVRFLTWR